ncbi:MAG: Asp-tRNA(Asn)/Glu-tRNA(Gln) amidotransferase subunit GatC [Nitrososphaerota archaeon]
MVKREEIERLADLIKIELKNPEKYVKQVEQIINYFERLDKLEISSDKILTQELTLDKLREDRYISYGEKIVDKLKHTKENFVKAPKMI